MSWVKEIHNKLYKKLGQLDFVGTGWKNFSQGYQDSVLDYIFNNIGTTNKFCVEFGFNSKNLTGGSGANTTNLIINHGWKQILFDSVNENLEINLHKEHLKPENIADVFRRYNVPNEPDYVSIDVDSIDLWLFKAILEGGFRPRVFSVEYNCDFPLTVSATIKPDVVSFDDEGNQIVEDAAQGASLLALHKVSQEFNYKLVWVDVPFDAFFVRGDIIPDYTPDINDFEYSFWWSMKLNPPMGMRHNPSYERTKLFVQYPSLEPVENPWKVVKPV